MNSTITIIKKRTKHQFPLIHKHNKMPKIKKHIITYRFNRGQKKVAL